MKLGRAQCVCPWCLAAGNVGYLELVCGYVGYTVLRSQQCFHGIPSTETSMTSDIVSREKNNCPPSYLHSYLHPKVNHHNSGMSHLHRMGSGQSFLKYRLNAQCTRCHLCWEVLFTNYSHTSAGCFILITSLTVDSTDIPVSRIAYSPSALCSLLSLFLSMGPGSLVLPYTPCLSKFRPRLRSYSPGTSSVLFLTRKSTQFLSSSTHTYIHMYRKREICICNLFKDVSGIIHCSSHSTWAIIGNQQVFVELLFQFMIIVLMNSFVPCVILRRPTM